jgi:uncharacterized DUF497 family protein
MHIEFDVAKNEANIAARGADGIRVISFRKANARKIKNYAQTHAADW